MTLLLSASEVIMASREQTIAARLRASGAVVEPVGARRWRVAMPGAHPFRGTARLDGDWLVLTAAAGHGDAVFADLREAAWELLGRNASIAGGGKFAWPAGESKPRLCAELPADEEINLAERVADICSGLARAAAWLSPSGADARAPAAFIAPGALPATEIAEPIRDQLQEIGWPVVTWANGAVLVELDVPEQFCQARIEEGDEEDLRLAVPIASVGAWAPTCRRALAALLTDACGVVRMARASLVSEDDGMAARWEVILGPNPAQPELTHALSALSVACRLCAREAQALEDEKVAEHYLAVRGWSS